MSTKIRVDESPENRTAFASFMKGEKIYSLDLPFDKPDGTTFIKEIIYEQATAKMIADIYADADKNDGVDEMFERTAQLFGLCIKNIRFNNKEVGRSDYEHDEMSVRDLTPYQKNLLEAAIAPGFGKSAEQLQQDLKDNSRALSKKLRGSTT